MTRTCEPKTKRGCQQSFSLQLFFLCSISKGERVPNKKQKSPDKNTYLYHGSKLLKETTNNTCRRISSQSRTREKSSLRKDFQMTFKRGEASSTLLSRPPTKILLPADASAALAISPMSSPRYQLGFCGNQEIVLEKQVRKLKAGGQNLSIWVEAKLFFLEICP